MTPHISSFSDLASVNNSDGISKTPQSFKIFEFDWRKRIFPGNESDNVFIGTK